MPAVRPAGITQNQSTIYDIADTVELPPTDVTKDYVDACVRAAQFLGVPVASAAKASDIRSSRSSFQNVSAAARNNVFDIIDKVNSFVSRAKNVGFSSPDNPFSVVSTFVSAGTAMTPDLADSLVSDIKTYLDLLQQETDGKIDLSKNVFKAAQLASVSFGLQGFGSLAATSLDLMKFVPDSDLVKQQKAQDVLAALDFRKRVPRVLFTADYRPDSQDRGSLVGWRRIADASGYVLKRHSVFENTDVQFTLSNTDLASSYDNVRDYVKTWVLSFYDNVDENAVWAYVDTTCSPDQYYIYRVQAFQIQNEEKGAIFGVDSIPSNLSFAQRRAIEDQIANVGVSPYPFISQQIFGDTSYDWIIAGVNVRKSVNRSDDQSLTRNYSYLGSDTDFLFSQMDQGLFFVPRDVNDVARRINDGVSKFGITQVMTELMQDTGILTFFEGIDPRGPSEPFVSLDPSLTSNFVAGVVSAIDPETATLDLEAFSANFPKILKGTGVTQTRLNMLASASPSIVSRVEAVPREIVVPTGSDDVQGVQFFDTSISDRKVIDLTTFDGLSTFLKTIRMFSDEHQPAPVVVGEPQAPASTTVSAAVAAASTVSTAPTKTSVLASRTRLLTATSGSI